MKDFIFLFRSHERELQKLSPDEMQSLLGKWSTWIKKLNDAGKYKFGDRLSREDAKVVSDFGRVVTDGPFIESKEIVGGYIIIQAESMDEAVEISKQCPVYNIKGMVEVRTGAN
ncbi:MAG: YciI family protein [Chlorobi bacterium]|nr:YciI family protein [Chlorobiota bacterium]MCI0716473.1 YciI family protein [Chlorobiota bacterium]